LGILDTTLGGNCPDTAYSNFTIFEPSILNVSEIEINVCNDASATQYPSFINFASLITGDVNELIFPPNYTGNTSNVANVEFEDILPGEYLFRYRSLDDPDSPCTPAEVSVQVNVIDCSCPILIASDGETCSDFQGIYDLNQLVSNDTEEGSWTFESGPTNINVDNDSEISIEGLVGSYEFTYRLDDIAFGCDESAMVTLTIVEQVEVTLPNMVTACDQVSTIAESEFNLNIFSNNTDGTWEAPSNYMGDFSDDTKVSFVGSEPGDYIFSFTPNVIAPCLPITSQLTIQVIKCCEPFEAQTLITQPCIGTNSGSITINNVSGGDGNYSYSIDGGANYTSEASFGNLVAGNYDIYIQDGASCQSIIDNISVNNLEDQSIELAPDQSIAITEGTYEVYFAHPGGPLEFVNLIWSLDGEVVCEGDLNDCPTYVLTLDGDHTVCLMATDINGCESSDCVNIETVIPQKIYIPTIFSPESDGNNSVFYIGSDEFLEIVKQFKIYDRWGELVYDAGDNYITNDPDIGWDGTKDNKLIEQGVYVYYIEAQFTGSEESELFSGTITVLR